MSAVKTVSLCLIVSFNQITDVTNTTAKKYDSCTNHTWLTSKIDAERMEIVSYNWIQAAMAAATMLIQ